MNDNDFPESIYFTQHSDMSISSSASNLLVERHVLSEWERREIYPTTEESQLYIAASESLY